MNTATPIRTRSELTKFEDYYRQNDYNPRNLLLIILGLNTALRISDILKLTWQDVYDFSNNNYRKHIIIVEQKTGKDSKIFINSSILAILKDYKAYIKKSSKLHPETYLFPGKADAPLSRSQAFRIIKKAANACNIYGTISPHSLRKTFGYHAWKAGIDPTMLMSIYNHSSFNVTKRYLGIEQDDRDKVFKKVCL